MLMIAETTDDNKTDEYQAFCLALTAVVTDAKGALPQCNGEIPAAERLILDGQVHIRADGSADVGRLSQSENVYRVLQGPKCSCADATEKPELKGFCQHSVARAMMISVNRRLARHQSTPIPHKETPMPETTTAQTMTEPLDVPASPPSHGIPAKFIVELHGKPFVTYPGLLAMAHDKGLKSISAHFISVTSELALAEASIEFDDGRIFMECADATPKNVSPKVAAAFPRMALTRAKCRALRDSLNVGMCAVEELEE